MILREGLFDAALFLSLELNLSVNRSVRKEKQEIWRKGRRQFFSVRIVDMKSQSGWDSVPCARNGILLSKKG